MRAAFVISVLVPDRPGIIADVSGAIFELGGNLEALSQTTIHGWFTMLTRATFPENVSRETVAERIEAAAECEVMVCLESDGAKAVPVAGEPYVVTVVGDDKPGIVRQLSCCCADRGVNIDDVWNEVREGHFVTIFHVTMPRDVDAKDFRQDLEAAGGSIGVRITLQHSDIFTATNSLSVHTRRG